MTIKEMATRLTKKLGGKPSQVSRALQHWTTVGLLSTAEGKPHQGTGRHRLYNEDALCRAAILLTLSQYGLQIKHLQSAMQTLSDAMDPKCWEGCDAGAGALGPHPDAFARAAAGKPIVLVYGFRLLFEMRKKGQKNRIITLPKTHSLGVGFLFDQNNKSLRDQIDREGFEGSFITVKLADLLQGL